MAIKNAQGKEDGQLSYLDKTGFRKGGVPAGTPAEKFFSGPVMQGKRLYCNPEATTANYKKRSS